MLPDGAEVTVISRLLTDPVKATDFGAIELAVVTAAVGKILFKSVCIMYAAFLKAVVPEPVTPERFMDAE
jgi:hypothetical protein